jgi:hypothetical protein
MGTPQQEQYPKLYCARCEGVLGKPKCVDREKIEKYGIVPTEHGAVVRRCTECYQLWLGYIQLLPNHRMKIIMKRIDKER